MPKNAPSIIITNWRSLVALDAINKLETNAKLISKATIAVVFLVTFPYLFVSVFRCGFQWGILSRTKWLPSARGKDISGFGIFVAREAPIIACGVSSMEWMFKV